MAETGETLSLQAANVVISYNKNYFNFGTGSQNAIAVGQGQVSNNVFGGGAQVGDEPKGPRPKVSLVAEDKGQLRDNKFYGVDAEAHAKSEGTIAGQDVRAEAPPQAPPPEEKTPWFRDSKWVVPIIVALLALIGTVTAALISNSKKEQPTTSSAVPTGAADSHGPSTLDGGVPPTSPGAPGKSP